MKIRVVASLGFVGADREEVLDIEPEDVDGLTEDEKEAYFYQLADEHANNYIETWYELVED